MNTLSCDRAVTHGFEPLLNSGVTCLSCETPFVADYAIVVFRVFGEPIGFIGPCCLEPDLFDRYEQACLEMQRC